jgi:hypothetical protein
MPSPTDEEQILAMLLSVDRQLRAVLAEIEAVTKRLESKVSSLEKALYHPTREPEVSAPR